MRAWSRKRPLQPEPIAAKVITESTCIAADNDNAPLFTFARDADKRITGFTVDEGRVRGIIFRKLAGS